MRKLILAAAAITAALFFLSCTEPEIPQGYALLYGVEDYYRQPLSYTADDAIAFGDLLKTKGWNVTVRIDPQADMPTFLADIESLKSQMNRDDRFLFYFSGHGVVMDLNEGEGNYAADEKDEVLVLYDALDEIDDFWKGEAIAADVEAVTLTDNSLADHLAELPTRNKTVIIDACNSGGFIGDGFTFSGIKPDYTLADASATFAPAESMKLYAGWAAAEDDLVQSEYTVLAAAGELELSYELASIGHGIFTYYLLRTPGKADYNYDGYITLSEAWQYISGSIDNFWNSSIYVDKEDQYMSNIAAFPADPVLFKAD